MMRGNWFSFGLVVCLSACSTSSRNDGNFHPGVLGSGGASLAVASVSETQTLSESLTSRTGPCLPLKVRHLDRAGAPVASRIPLTLTLSGLGSGSAFASLADCFDDIATFSLLFPQGASELTFYVRNYQVESNTLTVSAPALGSGALPTNFIRRPFTRGSGPNGTFSIFAPPDPTGRFYLFGKLTRYEDRGVRALIRLQSDGMIDPSFIATKAFDQDEITLARASHPNADRIFVVGKINCPPPSILAGACARDRIGYFTGNGTYVDMVSSANPVSGVTTMDVARDPTQVGKLYIGGTISQYGSTSVGKFTRLISVGTLDKAFNDAIGSGFDSGTVSQIEASKTGTVYVRGAFATFKGGALPGVAGWAAITSAGALDPNFSKVPALLGGSLGVPLPFVLDDTNGKIYATNGTVILRLSTADGDVDTAFDTGVGFTGGTVRTMLLSGDQLYVFGSFTAYQGTSVGRLVRLTATGSLDPSFQPEITTSNFALDPSGTGKLILAGRLGGPIRLNPDGSIDTSFNVGRVEDTPMVDGAFGNVGRLLVQGDSVLAAGRFNSIGSLELSGLAKFDLDGRPVAGFPEAKFNTGPSGPYPNAVVAAPDGSGKLYVTGSFSSITSKGVMHAVSKLARLNPDGSLDTTFDTGGGVKAGTVADLIPAPGGSGRVLIAGDLNLKLSGGASCVHSLLPDGSTDPDFALGNCVGVATRLLDSQRGDGTFYVMGSFTGYAGSTSKSIVRMKRDGTVDASFNAGGTGLENANFGSSNGSAFSAVIAGDGTRDLIVVGAFGLYNGTPARNIVRISETGALVSSFQQGVGPDGSINTIALANDGSRGFYVGGFFQNWDDEKAEYLARLKANGEIDKTFRGLVGLNGAPNDIVVALDGSGSILVGGPFTSFNRTVGNLMRLTRFGDLD